MIQEIKQEFKKAWNGFAKDIPVIIVGVVMTTIVFTLMISCIIANNV